jgi:pimeloyl-ACP methyl ester carboxylesterase
MKQLLTYNKVHRLSYAEYGNKDGYPILIQHGLIASIDDHDLFDRLRKSNLRLICVARPGYGSSTPYEMKNFAEWADVMAPLIEELALSKFDILAMSSGAPYGYALGAGIPDKVRNIFIYSGMPALYDEIVLSTWPYEPIKNKSMAEMETLAHAFFFSNLSETDLLRNDIRDSTMHNGFGVAQDLKLRFMDWGFRLSDIPAKVFMRHSKQDDAVPFECVVRTAQLLPDCELELLETGPHFSNEGLDDFIKTVVIKKMSVAA